jgi:hypothetical protein
MEKFLLIVREDLKKIGQFTQEERFARSPDMLPWLESLNESGQYIMGEPLYVSGSYVSQDKVITDGPFIEAKEGVSGFDLIWAESMEQAVAIAQSCPMVMSGFAVREVRQVVNMD